MAFASMAAQAAEIKVLAGSAVLPAMVEIVPAFEQRTGHNVVFDYGTVGGMAQRVQGGEVADVAIVSKPQMEALESEGRIAAGTRSNLGKVGIAAFVRKGAFRPDMGSVEAFKRSMLAAKSIGFNQMSEILAVGAVDLVAPLPAPIQNYTALVAGVISNGREQQAAKGFIDFLSTRESLAVFAARGFEAPRATAARSRPRWPRASSRRAWGRSRPSCCRACARPWRSPGSRT